MLFFLSIKVEVKETSTKPELKRTLFKKTPQLGTPNSTQQQEACHG
jgi:hypothetical protein